MCSDNIEIIFDLFIHSSWILVLIILVMVDVAVTCVESGDKALEYLNQLDTHQSNSADSTASLSSSQSPQQEVWEFALLF